MGAIISRGATRLAKLVLAGLFTVAAAAFVLHSRSDDAVSIAEAPPVQRVEDWHDSTGDGMPDGMRLNTAQDAQAFRLWFTFLAEVQFFNPRLPAEISDCAALLRYAYRESLRPHDETWEQASQLPLVLAIRSVSKVRYPHTLLGPALFRLKPGPLHPRDAAAFAQFADAKTLRLYNTHFISHDINRAEPGDLLFYRHEASDMPFHGMVYLGKSQIQDDGRDYVLYHTGPDGTSPGEVRRPSTAELLRHPNPGWRPVSGNPTFLGVYRWNILR